MDKHARIARVVPTDRAIKKDVDNDFVSAPEAYRVAVVSGILVDTIVSTIVIGLVPLLSDRDDGELAEAKATKNKTNKHAIVTLNFLKEFSYFQ